MATPRTDGAMRQMACFKDHPAVECLEQLARDLEEENNRLRKALEDIAQLQDDKCESAGEEMLLALLHIKVDTARAALKG